MSTRRAAQGSPVTIGITEASLARLGAKRLAALLFAASEADPVLARSLRMELLAGDPAALAKEIDRQIRALRRAQSFVDWRKVGDLVRTLDGLRASIAGGLAERDPAAAAERLFAFFTLAQPSLDRADDSNGRIGDVFRDACSDLGVVVAQLADSTAQSAVARRAFAAADQDGYGVLDDLVAEVAAKLPAEPLSAFRTMVEAELAVSGILARYLAPDAHVHRTGQARALGGAEALAAFIYPGADVQYELVRIESSAAGDLVFTLGVAQWSHSAGHRRGTFARMWQHRSDGWRIVYDQLVLDRPA